MVRARPRTPHELGGIKGMGSYRLEKYGAAILAAINGAPATDPVPAPVPRPEPVRPAPPPSPAGDRARPPVAAPA